MGTHTPKSQLGSTGKTIPLLGLGTGEFPPRNSPETIKVSVLHAIELGYRHFDSAALYRSRFVVGEAISEALRIGLVKSRDELFITSKLWCTDGHKDRVLPALQNILKELQLEYVDLYLIHWPVSSKPGIYDMLAKKEDLIPMDYNSVWEAMEECQKLGLAKSIGVSNFSTKKLETLLATAQIPPAVNQVEMNPFWQQKKLRDFCEKRGIHVTAYAPLGTGADQIMKCEVLKEIATSKGKTVAQVCLRWVHEQGVSVVAKSFNKERMKENLGLFDWQLSPEELQKISQLPQRKVYTGDEFVSDEGPYKSVEELIFNVFSYFNNMHFSRCP